MSGRSTLVILCLPWKDATARLPSKKAAMEHAEELVRSWAPTFELEIREDRDGDLIVCEKGTLPALFQAPTEIP